MICVIDRRETTIQYRAGCLLLGHRNEKQRSLPLNQLDQVVVYGNPLAETSVWRNLAEAAIPVVLLASRGRPQAAMLGSGLAVRLPLRRMQHRLADRPQACLAMARWFVQRKISGYQLPMTILTERFSLAQDEKNRFLDRLDLAGHHLEHAATVSEVMGIEGSLAQAWFSLLAGALPSRLRFQGRNRRPPRDPVNSLLSLAYTLLHSEVRQALLIEGFDPSLGFLHQEYPGREALALDFQEIFRTGVDWFILRWLADTPLDRSSFYYRREEGCRLAKATRPLFYQAWATFREQWPRPGSLGGNEQLAPIRELLLGQTAAARRFMTTLERGCEQNDQTD